MDACSSGCYRPPPRAWRHPSLRRRRSTPGSCRPCIPDAASASKRSTSSLATTGGAWLRTAAEVSLWGLTFEVSGRRRQDAKPARCRINHNSARAWWPAGGAPLDRGVRPHFEHLAARTSACPTLRFRTRTRHRVACCAYVDTTFDRRKSPLAGRARGHKAHCTVDGNQAVAPCTCPGSTRLPLRRLLKRVVWPGTTCGGAGCSRA